MGSGTDGAVLRLRVGAATAQLSSNDEELAPWLATRFGDLADGPSSAEPQHRLRIDRTDTGAAFTVDDARAYASANVPNVVDHFVSWCNRMAIESRPGHVNVHAAGLVAPGAAGCVVLPGAPGAGKSTLSAAALARGWGYLSDEVVSVGADGVALPYPKPVTIKPPSLPLLSLDPEPLRLGPRQMRWYFRPTDFGGHLAGASTPNAVVYASHEPDQPTSLVSMTNAEAALALAANCQDELDLDGRALLRLAALASACTCARLEQHDLGEAVRLLAELPAPTPAVTQPQPLPAPAPPSAPLVGPRVVDGAVGVALDDGVVVHHPASDALVALDPLAGAIWQLLDGSTPQMELARELSDVFDHPVEEVAAGVMPMLAQLRVHGLVDG